MASQMQGREKGAFISENRATLGAMARAGQTAMTARTLSHSRVLTKNRIARPRAAPCGEARSYFTGLPTMMPVASRASGRLRRAGMIEALRGLQGLKGLKGLGAGTVR